MRFGSAMSPLRTSATPQTSSSSQTAPTRHTSVKIAR